MKISVTRNTGWIGFAVRLKVFINGVEMAKVANAETQAVNIPLPAGDAAILTIKSLRTSSIQVQDGDQVLIETNPSYMTCLSIAMALLIISLFLAITQTWYPSSSLWRPLASFSPPSSCNNSNSARSTNHKNSPPDCFFAFIPV